MKNNILEIIFFLLLFIQSIKALSKPENIFPYSEKSFSLNNFDFAKIYAYYPKIEDLNHEIIVQINSSYNGNSFLCANYCKDKSEENIYYYSSINEFNCQKKFNIKSIENIEEYNITYNLFNSTNLPDINGYYLIILYKNKNDGVDFSGTITIFDTKTSAVIDKNALTKYFFYKNNYSINNYSFNIFPNTKMSKKDLHIQISTLNDKNVFNINFSNDNNSIIEEKKGIFTYNKFFNISNEEIIYYQLNISFLASSNNLDSSEFAIYFEYVPIINNLIENPDQINELNFLAKSDYYFYQNNSQKSDKIFYLANDFTSKRGMIALSYLEINNEELNYIFKNEIISSDFTICKNRMYMNSLTIFKCVKNMNAKNDKNILLLKISSNSLYPLKIRKIHFKELKKKIIEENSYTNGYFIKSFSSGNLIDKLGYFYIPKLIDSIKKHLVYCSKANTMSLYYGDYDIIEQNQDIQNADKLRLIKISHNKEENFNDNFDGFTIITFNKDINYFIQIIDINKEIYDNLLIDKISDKFYLNKEITFDIPIKNYYIFFVNEYNEDFQDIIFDAQIKYGKIDIKYIDIDLIPENIFNLNNILICNESSYSFIDANHPMIVKQTTEFIKITNLNFHSNYYYKAKFYLNKYFNKENKKFNSLIPIYLSPLESKIFSLENIYGNVKYFFKLGDNYNDYTDNNEENLVNIIIGNNNYNNLFSLYIKDNVIKGNLSNVNFGDTIKFINNVNKSLLIWVNLGSLSDQQENIRTLYLSKNFYYLYTFSFAHKLCFDWFNIKKKMNYGLIPQKILISLLNEQQTKTNGYYYQIHNYEDNNDNDDLLYYSRINSINYELETGKSHNFLNDYINITVFDYYYKEKQYINYMIYPISGLVTILFYVEYLYDLTFYINNLKLLDFDDSIYSINLKLDNTYIKNRHIYDSFNYLVFQCLSCKNIQSKVSFKYNNISYSQDDNGNNIMIKTISTGNVIGYIKIEFFNKIIIDDDIHINIIKPYKTYIKYYYTTEINKNHIFQNNYNINVEKEQNLRNNQNIFVISFDCFLKNIKTNYTILILNKAEIKNGISNECEFFFYLDNINNKTINAKYFSFLDNNENIRIKKEISFQKFGNYAIYILAQSLDSFSIYKFLGTESYTYTNTLYKNTINKTVGNKNQQLIAYVIFIILLIILIALFIVFRYVRKNKLIKLFNSLNNSLLSENILSSKNTSAKFNNINDLKYIDITNSINVEGDNYEENNFSLFEKPKIKEKKNENVIESNDNKQSKDIDKKELELDPELLCQSPAPLLGNTFCSEEDRIKYELDKINQNSNINNINNEIEVNEKKYINTNNGYG